MILLYFDPPAPRGVPAGMAGRSLSFCHPERSEGSYAGVLSTRFFAALRMTLEVNTYSICHIFLHKASETIDKMAFFVYIPTRNDKVSK